MTEHAFDWDGWYRRARPLLFRVPHGSPLAPETLATSLRAAMPLDLGARFAMPPGFAALMDRLGATQWRSQRIEWDFCLYDAATIVSNARYNPSDDEPEHVRHAGPWIEIGRERSKDNIFLCCDRDAPSFGEVTIGDDAHPWLPGGYFTPAGSLFEWLTTRFVHARARGWILLPLEPAERSAIDAARGGWDLLVAARDITAPYDPSNDVWAHAPADRARRTWRESSDELPPAAAGARTLYEDPSAFVGLIEQGAGTLVVGDRVRALEDED